MIKATRNGTQGIFSDADWKSGQPQRYGWTEEGKEKKTLPKEIINFIERRKAPEPTKEPEKLEFETALGETITVQGPKVTKRKTKSNDNPKQKDGGTAKRKPRRMEKN